MFAPVFLLVAATAASAYIEALYPLAQFLSESEVIAEGNIEKVDAKNRTFCVRVSRSLKGRCGYEVLRLNVGAGQEWHPDVLMKHLVVGAPALIFYNAERRAEIYLNRFFCQFYGDATAPPEKAWWTFTHIEIHCNRTFSGTEEELAKVVADALAGKAKAPAPNSKVPPITRDHVGQLPAWGQPADPATLPPSFRKRDPNRAPRPREPEAPSNLIKGLAYEYYEGQWAQLPEFDELKAVAKGTADQFEITKRRRDDRFAFRFSGFVEIPKDGLYTFATVSDDGSKLFIGRTEIVSNDGLHGPQEASGEIPLKAGRHSITVTFFQNEGGQQLEVYWEGPDLPKQKIPPSALSRSASP